MHARLRRPEPLRRGQRQMLLPDGSVLACPDAAAYDAWLAGSGRLARWQQSAVLALVTLALLIATLFSGWRRAVFDHFADAVDTALDNRALPKLTQFRLEFRQGGRLGANALALPGGTIVVTDELVRLLEDNPRALVGVLGHELGHVKHRHGMRLTLRASAVGLATGVMLGDFSVALASAPALLAQQNYSRGFEREADDYARTVLRGAGIDPAVMVGFFERMKKLHEEGGEGDGGAFAAAFSSHPADDERIAFFSK